MLKFILFFGLIFSSWTSHAKDNSAFDRIIKTNTLRCGYALASPWFMFDPLTGAKSGYSHDVSVAVAEKIGLDIEWVEETGWGIAEQGIITGRYDLLCGSVCVDPNRARVTTFSRPFKHVPILATVRINETRYKEDLSNLNDPNVKIGVKNGHVFEYIANERFPKATKVYANDLSDDTEFLLMLENKKIDIAFTGQSTIDVYEKTNADKIRALETPARFCNGGFLMPLGDYRLKFMLDNAIEELNSSGVLESLAEKYQLNNPRYLRLPTQQYR